MPIQIYWEFYKPKKENFQIKKSDIFHIPAQNIDCRYSLQLPHWGSSNEYPQSMFLSRNKKIMYTPNDYQQSMFLSRNKKIMYTPVLLYKSGV